MNHNKLVVLGSGWLGNAVAEQKLAQNWCVEATKRTVLEPCGHMRVFKLDGNTLSHNLTLEQAFWLCCIPPNFRNPDSRYLETLDAALALFVQLQGKGFLLCSSTGVYPTKSGVYNEQSHCDGQTARQQRLLEAENKVLERGGKVLRLGGLTGPGREPGQFVAGKSLPSHPEEPVNLIRREDIIAAIDCLYGNWDKAGSIYNLVYPAHPSKQAYYSAACKALGQEPPEFTGTTKAERIIDGSAIEELGFSYRRPL